MDDAGNVSFVGAFSSTLDFGLGSRTPTVIDAVDARLDATGSPLKVIKIGGGALEFAYGVDVDPFGNPVFVGDFTTELKIGADVAASSGSGDVFVIRGGR